MVSDDQPDAREGQAGRPGVAERPVVPKKPGNAGGGKGPQFKAGAGSGEVQEIGETLGNSVKVSIQIKMRIRRFTDFHGNLFISGIGIVRQCQQMLSFLYKGFPHG